MPVDFPPLPTTDLATKVHCGVGSQGVCYLYPQGRDWSGRQPIEFTPEQLRGLRNRIDQILDIVEP
jgi:hypothetical protein